MLWVIYGMVALQSLLDIAIFRVVYRLWERVGNAEWITTERIDALIEARKKQREYEEAQAVQHAYGVPARTSRPFVPSRPLGGVASAPRPRVTLPPLGEVWEPHVAHQNGYTEWNG